MASQKAANSSRNNSWKFCWEGQSWTQHVRIECWKMKGWKGYWHPTFSFQMLVHLSGLRNHPKYSLTLIFFVWPVSQFTMVAPSSSNTSIKYWRSHIPCKSTLVITTGRPWDQLCRKLEIFKFWLLYWEARAQVSLMEIKDAAVANLDNSFMSTVILLISSWSLSCWNWVTGQRLRQSWDRSDLEMHSVFSWIIKLAMWDTS